MLLQCCVGGGDLIEFGGSADLDSRQMLTKETLCGCDTNRIKDKVCHGLMINKVSFNGEEEIEFRA